MTRPYQEGSVFGLPLEGGGFCRGVVARAPGRHGCLICYFFGPRLKTMPAPSRAWELRAEDARIALFVGHLHLVNGRWPVLGRVSAWSRKDWPMPSFVWEEPFSEKAWRVTPSEEDPRHIAERESIAKQDPRLPPSDLFGAEAAEGYLDDVIR